MNTSKKQSASDRLKFNRILKIFTKEEDVYLHRYFLNKAIIVSDIVKSKELLFERFSLRFFICCSSYHAITDARNTL